MADRDQGETDGRLKVWGEILSEEMAKNAEAGSIADLVQDTFKVWEGA